MGKPKAARKFDEDEIDIIVERKLDARPLTTYSQFVAEITEGRPDAGVIRANVNLTTLMGGMARFRPTEAQGMAAAKFRALWDRGQVGGARAVDPAIEHVDGGYLNPEGNIINGEDARRDYIWLTGRLGRVDTKRLFFVVVMERGPTAYARWRFGAKPDGRTISRGQVEVRNIADRAAELLKLQSRGIAA